MRKEQNQKAGFLVFITGKHHEYGGERRAERALAWHL